MTESFKILETTSPPVKMDGGELDIDNDLTNGIGRGMLIFDSAGGSESDDDEQRTGRLNSHCGNDFSSLDSASIISISPSQMKVKFDIITTKLVKKNKEKYTAYVIMIMELARLDLDRVIIERRYNEFSKLHSDLLKECPSSVKHISFPKKKLLSSNFDNSIIEGRSRKFEKYLRYIFHQEGVADTKAFQIFFYKPHLKAATQYLKGDDYQNSYDEYRLALQLQKKLGGNKVEMVATMCGVVETCKNMKKFDRAEEVGSECLELLQYDASNPYLLPLIHSVLDARKKLYMNTDGIKAKLKECEKKTSFDTESLQTLRELCVKRY